MRGFVKPKEGNVVGKEAVASDTGSDDEQILPMPEVARPITSNGFVKTSIADSNKSAVVGA